ncbi:hypothetical protein GJAV_G00123020 [Gymnothorax javanicus]|nr:hypothetical protein GJAV_G00123020 [Gymnothorax javanicus]
MGLTDCVLGWVAYLLLTLLLVDCVPLMPRMSWAQKPQKGSIKDPILPPSPPVRTVSVRCHEAYMEILVNPDLFGIGVVINPSELRLGVNPLVKGAQPDVPCGAVVTGEGEYAIFAEFTDCGTTLTFTNDSLVYKNSLFYAPALAQDGIIRLEETEIPFECHYNRQYSVDSNVLVPTWIPFMATQSAEEGFDFVLRFLTADLRSERASNIFFLGDLIFMEAYVVQGNHVPLRVFVDTCMATLVPDLNSDPRYTFIEDGCFTDAWATGSSSRFLPRVHDNFLHMQLDAFRFFQDSRNMIFITCLVKAEAVALTGESSSKACSYIDGRWTAADGNDQACRTCGGQSSTGKKTINAGVWKRGTKEDEEPAERIVTIGPLVFKSPQADAEVLMTRNSGTSVGITAVEGSTVDSSAVPTKAGTVVDTPKKPQDKQEDEVLEAGQDGTSDDSTSVTRQSSLSASVPLGLSSEVGTVDTPAAAKAIETLINEEQTGPSYRTPG